MTKLRRALPSKQVLREAVELAARAPSIHNTQPWRWRITGDTVDLFADRSRRLRIVDPRCRALRVSCGAALFQLRIALAAEGWRTSVTRLPNPFNDDHLAAVLITGSMPVTVEHQRLRAAAERRRTDRRPFAAQTVDAAAIQALIAAAASEGAHLHRIVRDEDRLVLAVAVGRADEIEAADPSYLAEIRAWSGRPVGATEGVPAASVPHLPDRQPEVVMRDWELAAPGTLQAPAPTQSERADLLVLATTGDSALDQVRAGEALERVLLTATGLGLSASPYTQPLEVPGPCSLMHRVVGPGQRPQIALRVGRPGPGTEPPLTPRRPLTEILEEPETAR